MDDQYQQPPTQNSGGGYRLPPKHEVNTVIITVGACIGVVMLLYGMAMDDHGVALLGCIVIVASVILPFMYRHWREERELERFTGYSRADAYANNIVALERISNEIPRIRAIGEVDRLRIRALEPQQIRQEARQMRTDAMKILLDIRRIAETDPGLGSLMEMVQRDMGEAQRKIEQVYAVAMENGENLSDEDIEENRRDADDTRDLLMGVVDRYMSHYLSRPRKGGDR